MRIQDIDVNFDFTTDTTGYWDNYWNNEMGYSPEDPDSKSPILKEYHKLLWSKPLPNGEIMNLQDGQKNDYLIWKDFRFGSDSITASFRYEKYHYMIKQIKDYLPNYKEFIENYIRKCYTIGGMIIFPKKMRSINQMRGCNPLIRDRFDLTLECIRRYYNNETNPLYNTLLDNRQFFDLFVDFKGYVDFFYLQDLVSNDYKKIKFMIGDGNLDSNPLPQSVNEYLSWMQKQLDFVKLRNNRISQI